MLRSRLSVTLLLYEDYLVQTTRFSNSHYLGDPLNTIKIFSEKNVDEIILLNIGPNDSPDFRLIESISTQCRVPLVYGGGLSDLNTCTTLITCGVEKLAFNSLCYYQPDQLSSIASSIGSQSVVSVIDYFQHQRTYSCLSNRGKDLHTISPYHHALNCIANGSGEILFQNVFLDGSYSGIDLSILDTFTKRLPVPFSLIGGLSSLYEVSAIASKHSPLGISGSSLFTLFGPNKAFLPNYPSPSIKRSFLS